MSIVAELTLSSDGLPLAATIAETDVVRIRFEAILPTRQFTLPFFRLWGENVERAVEVLRSSPAVESITLLETGEETGLCQAEWQDETIESLQNAVNETSATLLAATVNEDEWVLRLRAYENDELAAFQQHCREAGLDPELTSVATSQSRIESPHDELTPAQYEALVLAANNGYFAQPREVTMAELAEEAGISRQAFSGRLRRGQRNLVRHVLVGP